VRQAEHGDSQAHVFCVDCCRERCGGQQWTTRKPASESRAVGGATHSVRNPATELPVSPDSRAAVGGWVGGKEGRGRGKGVTVSVFAGCVRCACWHVHKEPHAREDCKWWWCWWHRKREAKHRHLVHHRKLALTRHRCGAAGRPYQGDCRV
jgi:hypothetical protein